MPPIIGRPGQLKTRHFLSITDVTPEELRALLFGALSFKDGKESRDVKGRSLALLFEKPSLRTRLSFEVAMAQLGGHCIYLSPAEVGVGKRESVRDVAQVISRMVDAVAARTFAHSTLEDLASYGTIPVINALSDLEHPCQALADLLTLFEHQGDLAGKTIAYVGDGNNCAISLLYASAMMGVNFRIASPPRYELPSDVLVKARKYAGDSESTVFTTNDPKTASQGADAIYTDVWASMGQEEAAAERHDAFAGFQVGEELFAAANSGAILLHPLPAHHGEEVAEGLLYQPRSAVFDQAENRLHVQKALLAALLK